MTWSTQNAYHGPGWNDCQPGVFAGVQPQRLRSKPSRNLRRVYPGQQIGQTQSGQTQTGQIGHTGQTKPTELSKDRTEISVDEISVDEISAGSSTESVVEETRQDGGGVGNATTVARKLQQVLELPSQLGEREKTQWTERLSKTIPGLEGVHLQAIERALDLVLGETQDAAGAREVLVQHSLVHNGVSAWVVPLRRVVERVK